MSDEVSEPLCSSENAIAEAVFFLFKTGEALLEPTVRLFIASGVCLMENQNDTQVCDNLSAYPEKENHVQQLSAYYLAIYKLVLNLPVIFLAAFCGAWSDRIGRKLPIIMSAFGTIVAVVFYLTSVFLMASASSLFLTFVFLAAAVRGAFGRSSVMTMAVHSYVSDISSKKSRTQKLSKLLSMNYFGCFLGSLLTGALLQLTDFVYVFTAVVVVNSLCVFITIYSMRESVLLDVVHQNSIETGETNATKSNDWKSRIPFRWTHVKESLNVLLQPRTHHNRAHLVFFFVLIFIQQTCKSGEVDITVLFTAKSPLSWSESTYGYLLAVDYACLGISSAFLLPGLVHFIHLEDTTLCIVGVAFKLVRLVMMAYGRYTWVVFLSVVVGSPSALIISSSKSMISKLVGEGEMGKTFSLLSCGETVANLIGSLTFTAIYAATVHIYPGLTFIGDACLMVVLLFAIVLLIFDQRRLAADASVSSYTHLDKSEGINAFTEPDDDDDDAVQLTHNETLSSYGTMDQTTSAKSGPCKMEGHVDGSLDLTKLFEDTGS